MDRRTYLALKKHLISEGIFHINSIYGALTVLAEITCFTVLFILLVHTTPFAWGYWILEILAGLSIFRFFVILHECGHDSLFRQQFLNNLAGSLAGVVCLHPYEAWRYIHAQHHQWVGVADNDPTLASLLKLKESPVLRRLLAWFWRFWLPIGFINHVISVFWFQPLQKTQKLQSRLYQKIVLSVCFTGCCHLALIVTFGVMQYLTLFGPMLFIFCLWSESVQLPLHLGLCPFLSQNHPNSISYAEQDTVTRSIKMPAILAILLGYNFYLHIEHHLFPTVPWYRLPKIKQALRRLNNDTCTEVELLSHTMKIRSYQADLLILDALPSVHLEP